MDRGVATIKAVVIGLGVAILGLAALLAVAVIDRLGSEPTSTSPPDTGAPPPLPAGSRIAAMTGGDDTLSLLVELPGGEQRIVTLDRRSGAVLGTLDPTSDE